MSQESEENIDAYLSSREREHTEDQDQPEIESSVAGGVYKAVVEGEGTNDLGQTPASTVEQPEPQSQPKQQNKRASIRKLQRSIADIQKQIEKQTSSINKINQVAQALQKQTKSGQRQFELIRFRRAYRRSQLQQKQNQNQLKKVQLRRREGRTLSILFL
jgi:predicted ribosome quality control (RQC) complex YloA/Tae2 family protein